MDSVEGIIEDDAGLPKGELDGDGVSSCGEVDSGAGTGAGEEVELSGAGVGTRVTEEAGGLAGGDAVVGADAARVCISTFIPWLQCPLVPQMKDLLPGEESRIVVVPPV